MFPEELIQVVSKHKSKNQYEIRTIYNNLRKIITSLKSMQGNMASELYKISISDDITNSTEILNDINTLKEQILYLKSFANQIDENLENRTKDKNPSDEEKSIPIFAKKSTLIFSVR